jgi:hypothetical protein
MKVHNLLVTGSLTSSGENIGSISSSVATTNNAQDGRLNSLETTSGSIISKTGSYATTGSNVFVGTQTISGSIIPSVNGTYDLGSSTHEFRHLYLSSASLYIDGTKVLGSTSQELQITTDTGQSFKILEAGSDTITLQSNDGNITLATSGGGDVILDPTNGVVALKGTTTLYAGNRILSSDGNAIQFGNSVTMTGSLIVTGFIETQELRTTYISSSILFRSGSTKFGDELSDTHAFTGSLLVSGSISVPSSGLVSGSSQITYSGLTGIPSGIVSGSAQVSGFGLATTGSNTFVGNQIVSGSFRVSGSIESSFDNLGTEGGQLILRGPVNRYNVDNWSGNALRIFREDDSTAANGNVIIFASGSGQVGINKNSTNATLDVNGNALVSGSLTTTGTSTFSGLINSNFQTVAANGSINVESLDPAIRFRVTSGTANSRIYEWRAVAAGGVNDIMQLRLWNDAQNSASTLFSVSPTGAGIFSSSVTATSFELGNGQYFKARRSSGNLLLDLFGIESGTDDIRILSTGDFNIKSGGLSTLFTVKSSGHVGVGTSTPNKNNIGRALTVNASSGTAMYELTTGDSSTTAYWEFGGTNSSIINIANGYSRFGNNNTEMLRLTNLGNLTFNTSNVPSGLVQEVNGNTPLLGLDVNFRPTALINTNFPGAQLRVDMRSGQPPFSFLFRPGGSVTDSVLASVREDGVRFRNGATSLNYYEEGTWTPLLVAGGSSFTMSGINGGRYTRIGNQVTVTGQLQWSSGSGSGMVQINGLPFASGGGIRTAGSMGAVGAGISFNSGFGQWILVNDPTTSFIYIIQQESDGSGYSHAPIVSSSGVIYGFSITYFI